MKKYKFASATVYQEEHLLVSVNDGPVTTEMLTGFLGLVSTVRKEHGRVLLLVDATRTYPVTKDARRYLAEWSRANKFDATAIFGAGMVMRAALSLASRAMSLLGQQQIPSYFATEAEARAWLGEQRRQLQLNGARPGPPSL